MSTLPQELVTMSRLVRLDTGGTRVPLDNPEVIPTTRRTFLTRAALAGALVTVGTAGPLTSLLPVAGAQDATGSAPKLDDATFAAFAVPLEMAAVQAYQAALDGETLGDEGPIALDFQSHHQSVVDVLTSFLADDAPTAVPDAIITSSTTASVKTATVKADVLTTLSELEDVLAATHLYALGGLVEPSTAKVVAQVLAVESQHAAYLGRAGGGDVATLTPPAADASAARVPATTAQGGTK